MNFVHFQYILVGSSYRGGQNLLVGGKGMGKYKKAVGKNLEVLDMRVATSRSPLLVGITKYGLQATLLI